VQFVALEANLLAVVLSRRGVASIHIEYAGMPKTSLANVSDVGGDPHWWHRSR
jgi:hypothetical protein